MAHGLGAAVPVEWVFGAHVIGQHIGFCGTRIVGALLACESQVRGEGRGTGQGQDLIGGRLGVEPLTLAFQRTNLLLKEPLRARIVVPREHELARQLPKVFKAVGFRIVSGQGTLDHGEHGAHRGHIFVKKRKETTADNPGHHGVKRLHCLSEPLGRLSHVFQAVFFGQFLKLPDCTDRPLVNTYTRAGSRAAHVVNEQLHNLQGRAM